MTETKKRKPFLKRFFIMLCVVSIISTVVGYSYIKEQEEKAEAIYQTALEEYDGNYSTVFINNIKSVKEGMYLKPKNYIRAFLYAIYEEINGNYEQAISYYSLAISDEKADEERKAFAYFKIALIYLIQTDYNNAIFYLNEAIKFDDSKSFYYLYRSECLLQTGLYESALKDVKKYEQDNTLTTDQLNSIITVYLMVNDFDGAIEYINKAMTYEGVDYNNLLLYRAQANILNDNYEAAYLDSQEYADNKGDDVVLIYASNLYACLKYEMAIELYYLYISEHKNNVEMSVYEAAAECAYDGDDYDALLNFSSLAIKQAKTQEDIAVFNKWYGIALMQKGSYNAAINALNIYLDYNPEHYDLFYIRALCYFVLGKYNEAIDDFTIVIAGQTMIDDSLYNRALSYYQIGEEDKCIEDLNTLILIGSDIEVVASAKELLQSFNDSEKAIENS